MPSLSGHGQRRIKRGWAGLGAARRGRAGQDEARQGFLRQPNEHTTNRRRRIRGTDPNPSDTPRGPHAVTGMHDPGRWTGMYPASGASVPGALALGSVSGQRGDLQAEVAICQVSKLSLRFFVEPAGMGFATNPTEGIATGVQCHKLLLRLASGALNLQKNR